MIGASPSNGSSSKTARGHGSVPRDREHLLFPAGSEAPMKFLRCASVETFEMRSSVQGDLAVKAASLKILLDGDGSQDPPRVRDELNPNLAISYGCLPLIVSPANRTLPVRGAIIP